MYGGFFVDVHAPIGQVQQGAEIMYYGGDIVELLLAGALVATWRPERRQDSHAAGTSGSRRADTALSPSLRLAFWKSHPSTSTS